MNKMPEPASGNSSSRVERLERLLDAGRALTSELDLDAVLAQLLETGRELTGAKYAAVGVLDERRRVLARFLTSGLSERERHAIGDLPRGHGILGLLIDRPEPLRLHDVSEHPRSYGFPLGHPPMHGFLGVPIAVRGEAWGNLYLTDREDGEDFDDDDLEAIGVLAQWAGIAIDNARLFGENEARRAELERSLRTAETAMDIATAVGSDTDLDRVLDLIAKRARALVEADALVIWLLDGGDLRSAATAGHASVLADARVPLEGSTTGEALRSGRPIRVDDVSQMAVAPSRFGMESARTALVVPLVHRGQSLGALMAFDRIGAERFGEDDERALTAFAASAATAVATARSVESQRLHDSLAAAESERRHWARELHDVTLQGLASMKLALSGALRAAPDDAREVVAASVEQLDEDIRALREIIADLRPAALDELGLEPALRTLVARTAARGGLTAETDLADHADRLDPDVEIATYRVAQEALTNVVKHAQATRVRVSLAREPRCVRLVVSDDGVGAGDARGSGYGVTGMRERAAMAGGSLSIDGSGSEPGTTVTLTLPI